jgi:hypothetical protein
VWRVIAPAALVATAATASNYTDQAVDVGGQELVDSVPPAKTKPKPKQKRAKPRPKLQAKASATLQAAATAAPQRDPNTTYELHFDGQKLRLFDANGCPLGEWDAVSGRAGYQSKDMVALAGKGPIPEGYYLACQTALQQRPTDLWETVLGKVGRGSWPGGWYSWGDYRVWLQSIRDTNTHGRDGFTIHGGSAPGSAGCIDLTSEMNSFVQAFKAQGKDLILKVDYTSCPVDLKK